MREKECNEKEIGISIIVPVYNVENILQSASEVCWHNLIRI